MLSTAVALKATTTGRGQNGLADDDTRYGEQEAHLPQRPPVGDKGVHHKTDENRWKGQRRIHQEPRMMFYRGNQNTREKNRLEFPRARLTAMEQEEAFYRGEDGGPGRSVPSQQKSKSLLQNRQG